MKVQLVVVRGKPEGKVIPLVGSNSKSAAARRVIFGQTANKSVVSMPN